MFAHQLGRIQDSPLQNQCTFDGELLLEKPPGVPRDARLSRFIAFQLKPPRDLDMSRYAAPGRMLGLKY